MDGTSRLRSRVAAVFLWIASCGCGSEVPLGGEVHDRPNVIVISLDTTRADFLESAGHPWIKTPHLDAIAAGSHVFTACMSPVNTTLASHSSLFTGRYPRTHGVPRNGFLLNDRNTTLAEILKQQGYHTAGFVASFALNRRYNLHQGYDLWDDAYQGKTAGLENQRSAERVTDAALAHVDGQTAPAPVHLFVHYYDPHRPYDPPPPYDALYDEIELADYGPRTTCDERDEQGKWVRPDPRCYAGEISYMDSQIGRLLEGLDSRGLLEHSILLVVSDHGELLDDKSPNFSHGVTVFQQESHVICMLRVGEAGAPARRVEGVVSTIDLLPTVLDILGLPVPNGVEGKTIPLTHAAGARTVFGEASQPGREKTADSGWFNRQNAQYARDTHYKLIRIPHSNREHLYSLSLDPGEKSDLLTSPSREHLEVAEGLRALLRRWNSTGNALPTRYIKGERNDTAERLRALGYVE